MISGESISFYKWRNQLYFSGTTNQAAKSVLGQLDPVSAAINIILGKLSKG